MTFPILVEPFDGQFCAKLVGEHGLCVVRPTREEAVACLTAELKQRVERGELVTVEVSDDGLLCLAGQYADDASLVEICGDAYAKRDRDRDAGS